MNARSSRKSYRLNIPDVIKAASGKLIGGSGRGELCGVSTDTRSLKEGELFIAIEGPRFDGHKFLAEAVKKKAAVLVVSKKIDAGKDINVIRVRDTTQALGAIAAFYRRRFSIPVIAVTGSAGKTTTKELIAFVLGARFNVLKNYKTENNQYGVPLTLLKLNEGHAAAVLELGTNHPGEIAALARIVAPDVAVFTNVGESHLEGLKTPAGVFREKFQLARFTKKNGTVVFNADDEYLRNIAGKKIAQKKISYGIRQKADHQAGEIEIKGPAMNLKPTDFDVSPKK